MLPTDLLAIGFIAGSLLGFVAGFLVSKERYKPASGIGAPLPDHQVGLNKRAFTGPFNPANEYSRLKQRRV